MSTKAYDKNPNLTDKSFNPSSDLFDEILQEDKLHKTHKSLVLSAYKKACEKAESGSPKLSRKTRKVALKDERQISILAEDSSVVLSPEGKRGKGRPSKAESERMENFDKDGQILMEDELKIMDAFPAVTACGWLALTRKTLGKETLSKDVMEEVEWVFLKDDDSIGVSFKDVCSMGGLSPETVRNEMFHCMSKPLQDKLVAMKDNEQAEEAGLIVDLDGVSFSSHKMSDVWQKAGENVSMEEDDVDVNSETETSNEETSGFDLEAFNAEFSMEDDSNDANMVSLEDLNVEMESDGYLE